MAVRTASVVGNWSNTATWGGSPVPVAGDTVVINVAVTLDQDADIGVSGANDSAALTISNTGKLTMGAFTLRARGRVVVSGVDAANDHRIHMVSGSKIEFDTTNSAGGVRYGIQMSTESYTRPMLYVRATQGNPAIISSKTTGGLSRSYFIDAGAIGQGCIDAEWLEFRDFGDNSEYYPAWMVWPAFPGHKLRLINTKFIGGWLNSGQDMLGDTHYELDGVSFTEGLYAHPVVLLCTSAKTTGTRKIRNTYFDKTPKLLGPKDFEIYRVIFNNKWISQAYPWASFDQCFLRDADQEAFSACGDVTNSFYLEDSNNGNPHGIGWTALDQDAKLKGSIIQSVAGTGGDFVFPHSPANMRVFLAENCILLPKRGGSWATPGKFIALLGGANTKARCNHNTIAVSDDPESGNQYGETYAGHGGIIDEMYSNIFWRPTASTAGYKLIRIAGTIQNGVNAAKADYNAGWNLAAGSEGNGYHCQDTATPMFSSGTPDVHGITGDPEFVDRLRCLETWAVDEAGSVSGTDTGKRDDAMAALKADPSKIADLVQYVMEGFAPQNPDYVGKSHDAGSPTTVAGSVPGAVAFQGSSGGGTPNVSKIWIRDTFTGTAEQDLRERTGETGATWTPHPSYPVGGNGTNRFKLTGDGSLYGASDTYDNFSVQLASGTPDQNDYDAIVPLHFLTGVSDARYGVVFDYHSTADSGWRIEWSSYFKKWILTIRVGGTDYQENVQADNAYNPANGTHVNLIVKMRPVDAGGVSIYLDSTLLFNSANTYRTGQHRVGMYAYGTGPSTGSAGLHYESITVGEPDFTLPGYNVTAPLNASPPGFESDPFKVSLEVGINPGSVTITPADSPAGGTFIPEELILTDEEREGYFTYIPVAAGKPYYGHARPIMGLASINPVITLSRKSGSIPCPVQFSSSMTTAVGCDNPWDQLEYRWAIEDPSGTAVLTDWLTGDPIDPRTDQVGPEGAYVFNSAGEFNITLKVRGWNGTSWVEAQTSTLIVLETLKFNPKGSPTGGDFTVTRPANGQTTAAIARTATRAQFQTALEAVYGAGNVEVMGSDTGLASSGQSSVMTVRLVGALAGVTEALPTVTSSLTGGTLPTVLVSRVRTGSNADGGVVVSAAGAVSLYLDPVGGSDAANGLTEGTAKQTWGALEGVIEGTGGNKHVRIKAGTELTTLSSLKMEDGYVNLLVTRYGAGANPLLKTTAAGDGMVKMEVAYGNSVSNIVFDGIDFDAGPNHSHGLFITSSNNGDNTQAYGYARDIYFLNGSIHGGWDVRAHFQGYNVIEGCGFWNFSFDGDEFTGQEILSNVERWCFVVGGTFKDGNGTALDHHIYPNVKRHDLYLCINFDLATSKKYCLNGNLPSSAIGGQPHRYMMVRGCDVSGTESGIELAETGNNPSLGRFLDVIIQGNRIHIGQVDTPGGPSTPEGHGVYVACADRVTVRDNYFYGNVGYDIQSGDTATDFNIYRNFIWKGAGVTLPCIRVGGITANAPETAKIFDNVMVTGATSGVGVINYEADEIAGLTIDGNRYYAPTLGTANLFRESDSGTSRSFAQWQALGFDVNGVYGNPLWTDPAAGDFSGTVVPEYTFGMSGGTDPVEVEISFTNDEGLTDASALTYTAEYAEPIRTAAWFQNMMQYTIDTPYAAGGTNPNGGGGYNLDQSEHYDPRYGYDLFQKAAIRRGLSKTDYSAEKAAANVRFRDRAVLAVNATLENGEAPDVPGHHIYASGIVVDWFDTGNTANLDALQVLMPDSKYAYSDSVNEELNGHTGVQREVAFALWTMLERRWAGRGEHPRMNSMARTCLKHIAQWTADPNPWGSWLKPWMGALTARALVYYWSTFQDTADPVKAPIVAQIPDALRALADYIWESCWIPEGVDVGGWTKGTLRYRDVASDDPRVAPLSGLAVTAVANPRKQFNGPNSLNATDDFYNGAIVSIGGTGDFNLVVDYIGATRTFIISDTYLLQADVTTSSTFGLTAPEFNYDEGNGGSPETTVMGFHLQFWVYWYLRRIEGDFDACQKYRNRGVRIFNASQHSWEQPGNQKKFNYGALLMDGLDYLARGDSEWPDATTLAFQAPTLGLGGTVGELSAPFRITMAYGVKLDDPIEIIPDTDGAGDFGSPNPVISTDRNFAPLAYTPDASDDDSDIDISIDTGSLGTEGPLTLEVGDGETEPTPVTSYGLSGPGSSTQGLASSNFTVTLGSGLVTGTIRITPAASAGSGSFNPAFLDLTDSVRSGTFTFTGSTAGARNISVSDNAGLTDPPVVPHTVNAVVTTYALSGPSTGTVGEASTNFTVTLGTGVLTETTRFTPQASAGSGTFNPAFLDLTDSVRSGTFTYTASSEGARNITAPDNKSLTDPPSVPYAASAAVSAVTLFTMSGPAGGTVGQPSGDYTVTLGTGTLAQPVRITPQASAGTGSFIPAYVDLTDSVRSGTFIFIPTSEGARLVSVINNRSLTNPTPKSYIANPVESGGIPPVYVSEINPATAVYSVMRGASRVLIIPKDVREL